MATDPPPSSAVPGEPRRRELILQRLRNSTEPRSIASLAQEIGVHPNTIRFHLESLVRGGRVEQLQAPVVGGTGRPPGLFRASRKMDPSGPTNYQLLATALTGYLAANSADPAATAIELGRSLGSELVGQRASTRTSARSRSAINLIALLDELGFKPEPPASRRVSEIRLRHCPFYELAKQHGEVVCSVHLGLMQGALSALRARSTVDRLEPFVEPDLCVAHLAPASFDQEH